MAGFHVNQVTLRHLEHVEPRFLKFIMWREAYNLWILRRLPRNVAGWYVQREEQGQDGSHLYPRIRCYSAYAKAYAEELDRLGWLDPIERIIKSKRFRKQYAKD